MAGNITQFIKQLETAVPPQNCENPYRRERPFAAQRRHNLTTYLQLTAQQPPNLVLVGEAPGYRGCRLTGIPFTSPHILAELNSRFGRPHRLFQPAAEWLEVSREASATIVWRTIGNWQPLPLLWNIFPFHPHQPGNPQSNRTPTMSEIAAGRPFLQQLLQIFPQTKIVAVGKKSANALSNWGWAHTAVRHPSHGGAKQFQSALRELQ